MATISVKSVRNVAYILGAMSALSLIFVLWSDRFTSFDANRIMPVGEAWRKGHIQGTLVLQFLLGVCAWGVWHLRSWARWLAIFWFPLLATNNLVTEFWLTGSVQIGSWLQAAMISSIWISWLYPNLASHHASEIFSGRTSNDDP